MALSILSATASQQYVLPSGISYSKFEVSLDITCSDTDPTSYTVNKANSPFVIQTNQPVDANGNRIRLLDGKNSPDTVVASLVQLSGKTVQVKADGNSPWISMGTYQDSDVQQYCKDHQALKNTNGDDPSSLLPVQPNPGIQISASRSAEFSLLNCSTSWGTASPDRFILYTIGVSDVSISPVLSETFEVQSEFSDGNKQDCENWSEAPWVKQ